MANSHIFRAGVMGWPIQHSLSPRLHVFWLQQYGIPGLYEALAVEPQNLETALRSLPQKGFRGVNLTLPHKQAACALVDHLDDTAKRIGAVNLITVDEKGQLHGRNTDAYGFMQNLLTSGFRTQQGSALVLGAGGGARAVVVALSDMGFSEIRVINRTIERAESLALEFTTARCQVKAVDWHDTVRAQSNVELLVNTTSLGMQGQPPLDYAIDGLPKAATVTDIVYTPLETALLRKARQRKHPTLDGLGMLLHQARPAFAAFFGRDPEVTPELRAVLLKDIKQA